MIAHLCGVRGSTPAPGGDFATIGGHTSCIALAPGGDADVPPTLVLDSGTGIRNVTGLLGGNAFAGTILLTHLHWDHVHGLPFFTAGDRADSRVRLLLPAPLDGTGALAILARGMSPPHFPIAPDELQGSWTFTAIQPGWVDVKVPGFNVVALEVPHKGGRTFGYRVSDGTATIAYIPDHGPSAIGPGDDGLGEIHEAVLALADGVDVLIHDSQHTAEELPARVHFGHSAAEYAVALGVAAGARSVVLFHHDPTRDDDGVRAVESRFADAPIPVTAAVEGTTLVLGGSSSPRSRAASGGT